jgi:hypothetical protein
MTGSNVVSGISAALDQARKGMRANLKDFNFIVPIAYASFKLGEGVALDAIAQGDLVSVEHERCYPFSEEKPFAGVCHTLSQELRGVFVTVVVRGAFHHILQGLTVEHHRGTLVHAEPGERRQPLNVLGRGIVIGQLFQAESLERSVGIVCFKAASDAQPFPDVPTPQRADVSRPGRPA